MLECGGGAVAAEKEKMEVLERRTSFSLDFWEIRPSEFVGKRSKAVLRSEASRGLRF